MHSTVRPKKVLVPAWLLDALACVVFFHVITPFGWMAPFNAPTADASVADTGSYKYMAYAIYVCAIFIVGVRFLRVFDVIKKPTLMMCIIGLAHLSVFWTIAPSATMHYLLRFDFLMIMLLAITANWGLMGMFRMFNRIGLVIIVASLILVLVTPGTMRDEFGDFRGLFFHKNGMGAFAAIIAAFSLAEYLFSDRKRVRLAAFTLCAFTVFLSHSATGLVILAVTSSVVTGLAMVSGVRKDQRFIVLGLLLLFCLLAVVAIATAPEVFLRAGLERDASLTGRIRVWQAAAQLIAQSPVLGYGYHVIGDPGNKIGADLLAFGSAFTHPHNGWLATGLQLGFVGIAAQFALFTYLTYLGVKYWWRHPHQVDGVLILVFMIGLWIRAVPESDFLLIPSFENAVMIMVGWTAGSLHRQRSARKRRMPIFELFNAADAIKSRLPEARG